MIKYDYIIIGSGIAGCCIAYELNKISNNILVIEQNKNISSSASSVAGGFLSPLLGKPNSFKDLVNKALNYSLDFYKTNMPKHIKQCGTLRLPKDKTNNIKFQEYEKYIDTQYIKQDGGYFFPKASVVNSSHICKSLLKDIDIKFDTKINSIKKVDELWYLDDKFMAKKLILTTGYQDMLVDEFYLKIRSVWGQRIDILTTSKTSYNYHKECSVSISSVYDEIYNKIGIGATHHRFITNKKNNKDDTNQLLQKAEDIVKLQDIKVINEVSGVRACSVDYFPLVGKVIDSKKTLQEFPYLKNGTKVDENRFTTYKNLYILNGLGGRGYVLAPYLAKRLCDLIVNDKCLDENIKVNRLFKREVKRL